MSIVISTENVSKTCRLGQIRDCALKEDVSRAACCSQSVDLPYCRFIACFPGVTVCRRADVA